MQNPLLVAILQNYQLSITISGIEKKLKASNEINREKKYLVILDDDDMVL